MKLAALVFLALLLPAPAFAEAPKDPNNQTEANKLQRAAGNGDKAAFAKLQAAAEQGDAGAQNGLGQLYFEGAGVAKDYAKAASWEKKAAEQGNIEAQNNLGTIHYAGLAGKKDYVEAMKWWRMAADQGDATAQTSIGAAYYTGEGFTRDFAEAGKWWRRAADQGHATAQTYLGSLYLTGADGKKDYEQGYFWLTLGTQSPRKLPGFEKWIQRRDDAAKHLSAEQITAAKKQVAEWKPKTESRLP